MKKLAILFLLFISGCKVAWTPDDERRCRGENCYVGFVKESKKDYCNGSWTSTDCMNKEDPNKDGGPRPKPDDGSGKDPEASSDPCKNKPDCPTDLGSSGLDPTSEDGQGGTSGSNGGGFMQGAGDTLTHWGKEIGKGWEGIKGEINGSNAEKRRKKREAKRLLNEIRDLWSQADGYVAEVAEDQAAIESSWSLLEDRWKEFGLSSREKDLQEFRGRYNTRTKGILDEVPVADPSVFDGMGKGRGDGVYPEHGKVEQGRKYLSYARGKLDPNSADYGVRKTLLDFGDAALDEAESSYRAGNIVEGNAWYDMGIAAADAALSITPGVGWAKDTYEAITGKNLLTGKELTKFERSMAIAGALTGGLAKFGAIAKVGKIVGVMATTAKSAEEAEKITQSGKEAVEILEASAKTGAKTADDVKDLMIVSQRVDGSGNVAKGIETVNKGKTTTDPSALELRTGPGKGEMSQPLYESETMLRGTNGNAGLVPKSIGEKMTGKNYSKFDSYRRKFWREVSKSKYASEFEVPGVDNLARMKKGNAPYVDATQAVGERGKYELHHITPINRGGNVYDSSNIMIVTPRFHKEVLTREYHYGIDVDYLDDLVD